MITSEVIATRRPDFQEIVADLDLYNAIYFKIFLRGEHLAPMVELMLRRILGRPDIKVRDVHLEHELTNLTGRNIRISST